MIWIWTPQEGPTDFDVDMDYLMSSPGSYEGNARTGRRINAELKIVYRSNIGLKRLRTFHSLPVVTTPVVDKACEAIIRQFVPDDQIQFYPITVIARGEATKEFSWVVILNMVRAVDFEKSDIPQKLVQPNITHAMDIRRLVLKPDGIGNVHLAKDEECLKILVSDKLKTALCEIVDPKQFCAPENIPTLYNLRDRMDAADSIKH